MSKHTAAPWYFYNDEEAKIISIATVPYMNDDHEDKDYTLAGIHSQDDVDFANARLIAAAPELLEALRELRAVMPVFPKDGDNLVGYRDRYNKAQEQTKAAIAKATGGAK